MTVDEAQQKVAAIRMAPILPVKGQMPSGSADYLRLCLFLEVLQTLRDEHLVVREGFKLVQIALEVE